MSTPSKSDAQQEIPFLMRLEKEVKGMLTTLLILGIIKKEKRIWGYKIKKNLKQLIQADSYISDSSLYTTLRSLEKKYGLLSSKMEERRRYYFLTDLGSQITDQAFTYWLKLVQEGNFAIKKLNFH